jgi:protein-disulfide isomerase
MQNLSRRFLVAFAGAAALSLAACNQGGGGAAGTAQGDMTMGNANAPVKVVEYASVTCSHCAAFNNEVFPAFKAKYIDTGKVHYTFRELLTAPEQIAAAGFLVARCAGKDKYFGVIDSIFRNQQEIVVGGDPRGSLLRVAQSAGLTEAQFTSCVEDTAALEALNKRVEQAGSAGVSSTPTFFINGKKAKEGAATLAELDALIAEAAR